MSDPAIQAFESELKNKLQFKASSKVSIDAFLFKAFKFFDLYNNGSLSRPDFFKAIAKCGVVVETHNLDAIYRAYDPQNVGKIDYRNFIENLLFKDSETESQYSQMGKSQLSQKSHPKESRAHSNREQQKYSNRSPSDRLKESHYDAPPPKNHPVNTFDEIIDLVSMEVKGDGISGLLNFANRLKATDINRTHLISPENIAPIVNYLTPANVKTLLQHYNPNKFGEINYAELIYGLKGNMNLQRQALVDDLFNMLDSEQKGQIQINRIVNSYKNRSEIGAFKRAIDLYCKFQSIDDGIFTDEDFNDFFEFVSFSFNEDVSFSQFVKIGFYTGEPARSAASSRSSKRQFDANRDTFQKNQSQHESGNLNQETGNFRKIKVEEQSSHDHQDKLQQSAYRQLEDDRHEDLERKSQVSEAVSRRSEPRSNVEIPQVKEINMILMRMKKTLAGKGTRGFLQFEKLLKNADTDADGRVSMDQFRSVIREQKIDITNVEASQIFGIFDQQRHGILDYQEVLHTLKGATPEPRRQLIARMWDKVKVDSEHTTFSRLKSSLNFRNHPDVQNGRKYDDQIWFEIQETLLMIQDLNAVPRSENISRDAFEEYGENLSLSIADDQLFESICQNFWKIGSIARIEDEYAGSRKIFDPSKKGYLQDHHRYAVNGGSVSQNAPFGTFSTPTIYTTEHNRL